YKFSLIFSTLATLNPLCPFSAIMTTRGKSLVLVLTSPSSTNLPHSLDQGPAPADPPELQLRQPYFPLDLIYNFLVVGVTSLARVMLLFAGFAGTPPVPLEEERRVGTAIQPSIGVRHSRDPVAEVHRRVRN
ncbi:hypothetical protein FRC00_000864, partial [Tulasnella sp. 408]